MNAVETDVFETIKELEDYVRTLTPTEKRNLSALTLIPFDKLHALLKCAKERGNEANTKFARTAILMKRIFGEVIS
jgi:hypothetical protein